MGQYRPRDRGIVLVALVGLAIALTVVPCGAGAAVADGVTQSSDGSVSDVLSTDESPTGEVALTDDSLADGGDPTDVVGATASHTD